MGQPRSRTARKFYRAAKARWEDARLLANLDRTTASIYLAGYAVECMLKALLLHATADSRQHEITQFFRGPLGHDLESIRSRLATSSGCNIPAATMFHFRLINSWTTDLRYEVKQFLAQDVKSFLNSVHTICQWAEGSM